MKKFLTLLVTCLPTMLWSADWAVRDSDRVLSRDEVKTLTAGHTLVFYDDGRSKYSVGGSYSYTYASGDAAYGQYEIAQDGTVCISYRNGFSRCDRYVENGDRIILLTEKGLRFPVRVAE
ncbi:MAG: hypothetical protein WBV71_10690 [Roseobacter sp.]